MNRPEPPIPSSAHPDALIGTTVNGRYRITGTIGVGGMGRVYRAEQLPLGRSVALKILHVRGNSRLPASELLSLKKRFFREANVLSKLGHPNIVTIYDYGAIESGTPGSEQYFIAMELLVGRTLAERTADGPMPVAAAVRIATQIAHALEEAHAQGIVHRDLKPSNVMLVTGRRGDERAKIIDFGIVKLVGDAPGAEQLTLDGAIVGSPKYMAPEQLLSASTLDRRADVWALGVVLYRMLTGRAAFDGETTGWLVHDVLNRPAPRVRSERPDAPPELDEIVARCLEKSPARRFASMADVAAALDALPIERTEGPLDDSGVTGEDSRAKHLDQRKVSASTLVPESLVAISTRSGTVAGGRHGKVLLAVAALGTIAAAGTLSTRALEARRHDVAAVPPTLLAATAVAPPEQPTVPEPTAAAPPPVASTSASPLASATSPVQPALRPHLPKKARPLRDDDIPAVR
jgi:serine/threonine protein kinase